MKSNKRKYRAIITISAIICLIFQPIYVTTDTLTGIGNFSAKGGTGGTSNQGGGDGGSGAGGRIAVYFNESMLSNWWASNVSGGPNPSLDSYSGEDGTMVFIDVDDNIGSYFRKCILRNMFTKYDFANITTII